MHRVFAHLEVKVQYARRVDDVEAFKDSTTQCNAKRHMEGEEAFTTLGRTGQQIAPCTHEVINDVLKGWHVFLL